MLKPSTTYYYRVKAVSASGESDYSNTVAVTTNSSNDLAVSKQNVTVPVLHKIESYSNYVLIYLLKAPDNQYVEEYKVSVSGVNDFSTFVYNSLTYLTKTNVSLYYADSDYFHVIKVGNLAVNTNYFYRISAVNSQSISSNLSFSNATSTTLAKPQVLGATVVTASGASVQWARVDNATSYELTVSANANFTSNIVNAIDTGNVVFRAITGLAANTRYFVRLRASLGGSFSPYSDTISFNSLVSGTYSPLAINIDNISILNVNNRDTTGFTFNWSAGKHSTAYRVDVSTSVSFASFVVENFITKATSYTAVGLTENTTYYFRVRANNAYMSTPYASSLINTLSINALLNPPIAINSGQIFSTSFLAQWVKRAYASRYKLDISTAPNFSVISSSYNVADIDSFVFDNLIAGTSYYWRVFALNTANSSTASNSINITTTAVLPIIGGLADSYIDGKVLLSWTGNVAYTKYYLTIYKDSYSTSYLGDGFFNQLDVGNLSNFTLDVFLEENSTYNYIVTGQTLNGDRKTSAIGSFYVPSAAPTIQVSNDGRYLQWSGNLNTIDVATDRQFKFMLHGYQARTIATGFDISNLFTYSGLYVRGYQTISSVKGRYSNILSTFTGDNLNFLLPNVTKDTATIKWLPTSTSNYRIQLFRSIASVWTLETGYAFPRSLGATPEVTLTGLLPNSLYQVTVQDLSATNRYSLMSLPLTFATKIADSAEEITDDAALTAPTVTITGVEFDRARINLPLTYTAYIIEVSDRSDFIYTRTYLEESSSFFYLGAPDTQYHARVYGLNTIRDRKSLVSSVSFTLPELSTSVTNITIAPLLSSLTEINNQEASVQWTNPAGSEDVVIEISQSNQFTYLEKSITINKIASNKAVMSGFYASNIYYIRMYAFNPQAISPYSNVLLLDLS